MSARPVGMLALEYLGRAAGTELESAAAFAYDDVCKLRMERTMMRIARDEALAERDALKSALEASRADAARLAEAADMDMARRAALNAEPGIGNRLSASDAHEKLCSALSAHRALSGVSK